MVGPINFTASFPRKRESHCCAEVSEIPAFAGMTLCVGGVTLREHDAVDNRARKKPGCHCWHPGSSSSDSCSTQVALEGQRPAQGRLELADRTESVGVDPQGPQGLGIGLPSRLDSRRNGSGAAEYIDEIAKGRKQTRVAQGAHCHFLPGPRPNCRVAFMTVQMGSIGYLR